MTAALALATNAVHIGGNHAVVVDCSGITLLDDAAIAALSSFAASVILSTATVHLYDMPTPIMLQLHAAGAIYNQFTSCSLLDP